jgi:hypothetical protein
MNLLKLGLDILAIKLKSVNVKWLVSYNVLFSENYIKCDKNKVNQSIILYFVQQEKKMFSLSYPSNQIICSNMQGKFAEPTINW